MIFTPNPEHIVQSKSDVEFYHLLLQADIRIPDGIGLIVSSRLLFLLGKLPKPLAERITGVDLSTSLLHLAWQADTTALLVGGKDYQTGKKYTVRIHLGDISYTVRDVEQLSGSRTQAPGKKSTDGSKNGLVYHELWWSGGFADVSRPTQTEVARLHAAIQTLRPAVVFVAFGAPYQERWVMQEKEFLRQNGVRVVLVVGGAFDMLLGKLPRAPRWMRAVGLEWLFRLVREPWRWRRQRALLVYVWLTLKEAFRRG
ncbi:MAG: WecB/TagA/CpsF family glycosyltransferase [Pseudomonadales bacterium]|nr:WecB/TagA/CpsF family glycosyltransferase [Candidatus Woesebacteria bacterium]MCB9801899.1 WecB/TagA/CpsF family glycosyltransferase [Pseudomonadales bacterium]